MARATRARTWQPRPHPLIGPAELLTLAGIVLVFAAWALWTILLPSGADLRRIDYVNGTFGASSQADYKTDLDRRLAPQRSMGRG